MKVFVTGGAGFVGRAVINALLQRGHQIHALVNRKPIDRDGVKSFTGGLFNNAALDAGMLGCDAVIHLVGIIVEKPSAGITFDRIHVQGTSQVLEAAKRAGIRRYAHMSALGATSDIPSEYLRTKFAAEELVRKSGLDWTIIEPSLIHGPGGDFTKMEMAWAKGKSLPFIAMPYFGSGLLGRGWKFKIQPVYVEDVSRAFAESIEKMETVGQTFSLGGPEEMTWPHMHRIAAEVIAGHPRATLPIPAWYAKAITYVIPSKLLPFTRDQVLMSQQDNVCDLTKFTTTFGWTPQAFETTLRAYAKRE